jgi:hypothetical protein
VIDSPIGSSKSKIEVEAWQFSFCALEKSDKGPAL